MKRNKIGYALLAGSMLFGLAIATGASADTGKLVEGCENCHGKDGANSESDVPNIGGLSAKYFAMTMDHYKRRSALASRPRFVPATKKAPRLTCARWSRI